MGGDAGRPGGRRPPPPGGGATVRATGVLVRRPLHLERGPIDALLTTEVG